MRSCLVRFEGENIRDSILVQQGELSDILGTYRFNFYHWSTLSSRNEAWHDIYSKSLKVVISESPDGQVSMAFPETNQYLPGITLPLVMEKGELRFYIHGGQRVGSLNPGGRPTYYSLFSGIQINNSSDAYSASGAYGSYASLAFQFYNEGDDVVARSFDNNSMEQYVTTGLMFFLAPLDETTITSENILGMYGYIQDIYLTKVKD